MKQTTIWIILMLLIFRPEAQGQSQPAKTITHVEQVWLGYFNQTRFSKRLGAWFDLQLRSKDNFFEERSQLLIRPGITYYAGDATKLTAGYAYIHHYPADNHKEIARPEHRPWQQVQWHTKYSRLRSMQYLRLEERFRRNVLNDSTLADGYQFNFRLRYNFLLQVPLGTMSPDKGDVSFIVNDEIHINFGKEVIYNYFDQNRFFIGFAYHLNANDNLQLGYLNTFIQLSSGNQYRSIHAARLSYFHNLDLRSKKG